MKLNTEKVTTKDNKKQKSTRFIYIASALLILAVFVGNTVTSSTLRAKVEVVKLTSSVAQEGYITLENMYKDTMLKAEYEKSGLFTSSDGSKRRAIVLWDDREVIEGAYASNFIRKDTPIYWDFLSKETPKKYAYLYKMDGELLPIDLDPGQFGEMLVPGDKVNIRASYQEPIYTLPTEEEFRLQQQTGIEPQTSEERRVMLFNSVSVLDILNSEGASIFDIYYDLLRLPKNAQRELAKTEDFKASVIPVKILLNATPEEADMYMSIQNKGPQYMMTMLPRTTSNIITEALSELQIGFNRD